MRLFQGIDFKAARVFLAAGVFFLLTGGGAFAQQEQQLTADSLAAMLQAAQSQSYPAGQVSVTPNSYQAGGGQQGALSPYAALFGQPQEDQEKQMTQAELDELLKDPNSPEARADALARRTERQIELEKAVQVDETQKDLAAEPPPLDVEQLQDVHGTNGTKMGELPDVDPSQKDGKVALDIRRDAQKAAALSYGARGALAKRNFQIMERVGAFEAPLDKVFNFRALLIKAPSGLLIEPPIVRESIDSLVIAGGGNEAAVADKILDINKQAKIVSAPRDWRQYLIQAWTAEVPPPPRILWPKNREEQAEWDGWVAQGWKAGFSQAEDMYASNLNRLVADYNGMVRYRMLLTQGMISQPYALHEDRGVTGTKTVMRVGDRALRITGPSQFLTGSELWNPADR